MVNCFCPTFYPVGSTLLERLCSWNSDSVDVSLAL